jgi:hypothetical protein
MRVNAAHLRHQCAQLARQRRIALLTTATACRRFQLGHEAFGLGEGLGRLRAGGGDIAAGRSGADRTGDERAPARRRNSAA